MRSLLKRVLASATALVAATTTAVAQGGGAGPADVVVRGTVTSDVGAPIAGVNVFLQGMNIGAQTGTDGRYAFTVSVAHATGQTVAVVARVIGYAPKAAQVTLTPGATITQDFTLAANPLHLGDVVITGAGTSTTRDKLATTINTIDSSFIRRVAQPQNVVSALAGAAPNVEVRTASGEPGASASIKIRGVTTLTGTGQPLFIVDGQPIDNTTEVTSPLGSPQASLGGTISPNRAADINPDDIESIEILKGAAATSIYGTRASNGIVLITTKRGHAGSTRYSLSSTETFDNVQPNIPLQRSYGQGFSGASPAAGCGTTSANCDNGAWGPLLAPGTPTYNHETEIYKTGLTADNNVQVSGGNEHTTFFGSGSLLNQDGTIIGPNDKYNRASVRLKAAHDVLPGLNIGGNFNYIDTRGRYIGDGFYNSGILMGALRAPPDFNNKQYLDPVSGLQRSYRFPNPLPGTETVGRGYDNPFWSANVPQSSSELGRAIANATANWNPLPWLDIKEILGADSYSDWRLQGLPFSSSSAPAGQVVRNDFNNLEIDHNLVATATNQLSQDLVNTLTVGQNLNSRRNRKTYLYGSPLNAPTPFALENAVTVLANESRYLEHAQSYFAQDEVDLFRQLYVNVGVRDDKFSTFGSANPTALYPKASVAWTFTNALGNTEQKGILSYGKLRLSYGESGKEPPPYAALNSLTSVFGFGSGFGDELSVNQSGQGGLTEYAIRGNPNLRPERTREREYGGDFGFFDQRADLSVTAYDKRSTGVILPITVNAASTGYMQEFANAASISNKGLELSLNTRPYTSKNVAWDVGVQYGRNHGRVLSLAGAQSVSLNSNNEGFSTASGSAVVGYAPGVFLGFDFARCGRGAFVPLGNAVANVDSLCALTPGGYKNGALFLASNGKPVFDPTQRVIADPNPKYTLSYNTSLKLFNKLTVSTLFDARHGGQVVDGTRAALYKLGTHAFTLLRNSTDGQFGKNFYTDVYPNVAGPGVDTVAFRTPADWQNWFEGNGGLSGPVAQFVEDGSFVKWRELSVSYTLDGASVRHWTGFSSVDLRIAGRNLHTWTKYQGLDPEASVQGAEALTQGLDFFNNPQTRSLVFSVNLNR